MASALPFRGQVVMTSAEWHIVAAILDKHLPGCYVWAFGSRVTGKTKKLPDLDLAILKVEAPGNPQKLDLITLGRLRDAFDESSLPFKVDIVDLASVSTEFRQRVEAFRVLIKNPAQSSIESPKRGG